MRNRISFGRAVRAVQAGRSVASFYSSLRNGVSMNNCETTLPAILSRIDEHDDDIATKRRSRMEKTRNFRLFYFAPRTDETVEVFDHAFVSPKISNAAFVINRIGAIFFLFLLFFYDTKQPYRFTNTSNHRRKEQITTVNFFSFSLSKDLFQKIPLFLFLSFRFIKCTCYI